MSSLILGDKPGKQAGILVNVGSPQVSVFTISVVN